MLFPGWKVINEIPPDVWDGLAHGTYEVSGGVIRIAKGVAGAGRIVKILQPASPSSSPLFDFILGFNHFEGISSDVLKTLGKQVLTIPQSLDKITRLTPFNLITNIVNSYQSYRLSKKVDVLTHMTQQILRLTTGTALLSGFGVAVSLVGFSVLNTRFKNIEIALRHVKDDIQEIKDFLHRDEQAKLGTALTDLTNMEKYPDIGERKHILLSSRDKLHHLHFKYKELLAESKTRETALAYEEYFFLTALAQVRCTVELDMFDLACDDLRELSEFWRKQTQHIAYEFLFQHTPERFLDGDFVEEAPIINLIGWLDFVYNDTKGILWVDNLRRKPQTYQGRADERERDYNPRIAQYFDSKKASPKKTTDVKRDKKITIPALQKFMARNDLLEGYISQYELLNKYQIRPSELRRRLTELPEELAVNGYFIFEPMQEDVL